MKKENNFLILNTVNKELDKITQFTQDEINKWYISDEEINKLFQTVEEIKDKIDKITLLIY